MSTQTSRVIPSLLAMQQPVTTFWLKEWKGTWTGRGGSEWALDSLSVGKGSDNVLEVKERSRLGMSN